MVVWNNNATEEPSYIPGKGWIQDQILPLEHLLHTAVEDTDNEPDLSDDLSELTSAQVEPESIDTADGSPTSVIDAEVPLRRSTRESRAPRRLIEKL